jgi:hypothetical protein
MPPWSDLVVVSGLVISTGWWTVRLRRRGLLLLGWVLTAAGARLLRVS